MPPKFRRKLNKNRGGSKKTTSSKNQSTGRERYIANQGKGLTKRTTGRGTGTTYGFAGSGIGNKAALSDASKSIKGRSETERLQSQLAGGQALQRRTMAQLGAGDIDKKQAKEAMAKAMQRIRGSAKGLTTLDPSRTFGGNNQGIMNTAGKQYYDTIMRGVTGGKGSNFYNMSRGFLRPGQHLGGKQIDSPDKTESGFSPYQGKDMREGLDKFAPISQGFSKTMAKGTFLPWGLKGIAAKRYEDSIMDTPRKMSDFTPAHQALRTIPEGADSMGAGLAQILDGEQIQKEAEMRQLIETAKKSGEIESGWRNIEDTPVDGINSVSRQEPLDALGMTLSDRQGSFDNIPLRSREDQEKLNAIKNQIAANTGILQKLPYNMDPTSIGQIDGLQQIFNMQDFVNKNPTTFYPYGYPTTGNVDTGLNMYGGGNFAEGTSPESRTALEILKSNQDNPFWHMSGGDGLNFDASATGMAKGGIANLYGNKY